MLIKIKIFELDLTGRIQFNFKIGYEKEIVIQHSSMHTMHTFLKSNDGKVWNWNCWPAMNVEKGTNACNITISSSTMKPWNHGEKQV